MVVKYEDATDIKTKNDWYNYGFDEILKNKEIIVENENEFVDCIKTEILAFFNANFYFKQYKINRIIYDYTGAKVYYTRRETEKEYYVRKEREETEYMNHLSNIEKEKYRAKEKIRKKYQQYEELKKYFENQNIEELLKD